MQIQRASYTDSFSGYLMKRRSANGSGIGIIRCGLLKAACGFFASRRSRQTALRLEELLGDISTLWPMAWAIAISSFGLLVAEHRRGGRTSRGSFRARKYDGAGRKR